MALRYCACLLMLAACSRDEPTPARRSAPWPAAAPAVASGAPTQQSQRARYAFEARGEVRFELPAREATPRGHARVVRGNLEVDLANLSRSRGTLEVDLASIAMDGDGDSGESERQYTSRALDWLDVGASRPEALRERMRWARFSVLRIEDASAEVAQEGSQVTLTAVGELELHGYRVERTAALRVSFERDRIVVRTHKPFLVSLRVHDVQPRDAHGALIAAELVLLGTRVGNEARVDLELTAKRLRHVP